MNPNADQSMLASMMKNASLCDNSCDRASEGDLFKDIKEAANADDGEARGLLVILSALRETIGEYKTQSDFSEPSATEYLAAILPTLEGSDRSHTPQLLALLVAVMPHVHRSLLRLKFPSIAVTFIRLLQEHSDVEQDATSDNVGVLQRLLWCMGFLLAAQESSPSVWSNPSVLKAFHVLLHFFADHRRKVRRAAHESVAAILGAHRGSTASMTSKQTTIKKSPASQAAEFCRAVLTSCTSQDVTRALHLLHFMRLAVPLFPPKQASSLCGLTLRLLSFGSPPLTAGVMQMLSAVVQSPRPCLTAPFLAELTRELLASQPSRSSGAGAVSFAPLLASCMLRLQSIDRESSGKLLAPATLALVDYCESSSSAVHTASCGALNLMFQACVDQDMVTKMAGTLGRNSKRGADGNEEEGGPLAACLAALETLLQYRFQCSWQKSLPLLGRLFLHLRGASFPILIQMLRGLGELHDALTSVPSAALPGATNALNEAVAFAIEGMGLERVLSVLPLVPSGPTSSGKEMVNDARAWLLPLLAQHAKSAPTRLTFFQEHILALAKASDCAIKSGQLSANEAHTQRFRVLQLWELLPGFCAQPTDVAISLGKLAPVLAVAMQDSNYAGILPQVCAGLQVLVTGVKARTEEGLASGASAKADLAKLSSTSTRFLPKLFALLDPDGIDMTDSTSGTGKMKSATGDDSALASAMSERTAAVSGAVAALASVAPASFLTSLFRKLLQKMVQATSVAVNMKGEPRKEESSGATPKVAALSRAQVLLDLAAGLAPFLDEECIPLLFRAIKPLVRNDASPQLQKRAYKVMLALCTHRASFVCSPETLPDVLDLFTSSLVSCHVSARVMRLQCLSKLVESFGPGPSAHAQFLPSVTLEVVLCTKDSNARTRELVYNVLVLLAIAGGNPADTVRSVVAGLAANTPHARSAAVLALGHLQLEFGHFRSERWDARVADILPELTRTMLILLKEPSREVVRAVLGWLRVAIGGADRELLRPMIGDIVQAVMSGTTPRHKDHFRARIRVVLSKLCRKFGFEEIKELMPEQDRKLVANMQSVAQRELKAKKARLTFEIEGAAGDRSSTGGVQGDKDDGDAARISKAFRTFDSIMQDSDEENNSDFEDEYTRPSSDKHAPHKKARGRKGGDRRGADMMVRETGEDGTTVVDLLDASMVKNMKMLKAGSRDAGQGSDSDADSDLDADRGLDIHDGRFVIPDDSDNDDADNGGGRDGKGKKRARDDEDDSDNEEVVDIGKDANGFVHMAGRKAQARAAAAAVSRAQPPKAQERSSNPGNNTLSRKRQKNGNAGKSATGAEYRSKKAGGDVWRKESKFEPYAYIPLEGRTLTSKKSGGKAKKQYGAVVGTTGRKKGYEDRRGKGRKHTK